MADLDVQNLDFLFVRREGARLRWSVHPGPEAYLQADAHVLRGCALVLGAVVVFFAFPILVGLASAAFFNAIGQVNPLGLDQKQPVGQTVALWIAVMGLGFLTSLLFLHVASPRRRVVVSRDPAQHEPIVEVRQDQRAFFRSTVHTVRDATAEVGRVIHHLRDREFEIVNGDGESVAVATTWGREPGRTVRSSLVILAAIVLFAWVAVVTLPRLYSPQKKYSLWKFANGDSDGAIEIGRFEMTPSTPPACQLVLTRDTESLPDRRLILALVGLIISQ